MSERRWTVEQAAAITRTSHTLLAANAGTGKTTTVVGKILWHLGLPIPPGQDGQLLAPCPAEHRIRLDQLAAITFTEKAAYDLARKLREEVAAAAPELLWDIDRASIGTIHSFAAGLLKDHALRFGLDPGFGVLDDRETRLDLGAVVREVVLDAAEREDPSAQFLLEHYSLDPLSDKGGTGVVKLVTAMVRDLRWHGDRYATWTRNERLDVAALKTAAPGWDVKDDHTTRVTEALIGLARTALSQWQAHLDAEGVRDFDAMVLDCRDRLADGAAAPALAAIRSRYRLLIIDEFQDTDGAQRDIAFLVAGLAGPKGPGPALFLVGDPKQSIYGFRGADISVWNEVIGEIGSPLGLTRNYRSDPAVVDYVNRAAGSVVEEQRAAVAATAPGTEVEWSALVAARAPATVGPALEWLAADGKNADERRDREADMIAARIRDLAIDPARGDTTGGWITDADTGQPRQIQYRDVALLVRAKTAVPALAAALARWGVPYYLAGNLGLDQQLELEDLLNLFQLVTNPVDDLAAFAYLRSPFVGLRDEVLARMRLGSKAPLLEAARAYLREGAWFAAPEHRDIVSLEQEGLLRGLDLVADLVELRSRVPLDQLAWMALERSGYSLHLQLMEQPLPRLANLQRFIRVLEGYRGHTVGSFLELWTEWKDEDVGLPQAPLYSRKDDVVTVSTIHAAKGLEWPVVFLADLTTISDKSGHSIWIDRAFGPVVGPNKPDRGPRATVLCERRHAEAVAEEARVFYVAATRARDRLIVAGPQDADKGRAEWAKRGRTAAMPMTAEISGVEPVAQMPEPSLAWLDTVTAGGTLEPLVAPLEAPALQYTRSATELMSRARGGKDHRLMYLHGIQPVWRYAREGGSNGGLRADLRGVLVHGVLERIQEEDDVTELLDVVVGAIDAPELEEYLARDSAVRSAIEEEIRRVVSSAEWRWYVEGAHFRELRFVQFRSPRRWRIGAMDLYRPGHPTVIVDFKTQDITPGQAKSEAQKYRLQAATYRVVARAVAGVELVENRFHFTRPGVVESV